MGKAYLNKNVKFQCQNGNAVWFNAQNGAVKVKIVILYHKHIQAAEALQMAAVDSFCSDQ